MHSLLYEKQASSGVEWNVKERIFSLLHAHVYLRTCIYACTCVCIHTNWRNGEEGELDCQRKPENNRELRNEENVVVVVVLVDEWFEKESHTMKQIWLYDCIFSGIPRVINVIFCVCMHSTCMHACIHTHRHKVKSSFVLYLCAKIQLFNKFSVNNFERVLLPTCCFFIFIFRHSVRWWWLHGDGVDVREHGYVHTTFYCIMISELEWIVAGCYAMPCYMHATRLYCRLK